ncbi:hypothetical protein B7P43_G17058 [Cryptotermes secundus]|uniref:Uncharacterized protein n=1 Tax=Cryptotermes secundus TaxID=105785 RepID=A0A2J7QR67_9NEOP|nr:hypothetical protein B7P43_G17058 [Cryptotermes secundus]
MQQPRRSCHSAMNWKAIIVVLCLLAAVSVEGSKWTKIRDKVKHEAEKVGKIAVPVLEKKLVEVAVSRVGK